MNCFPDTIWHLTKDPISASQLYIKAADVVIAYTYVTNNKLNHNYKLRITNYIYNLHLKITITNYKLQITNYKLQITNLPLLNMECR